MNCRRQWISDAFHVLAQPITALRVAAEFGLRERSERKALKECVQLLDRLTRDLAIFREIAGLDEEAPLQPCEGHNLLQTCVDEMAPIAQARTAALQFTAQPVLMQCNPALFERAVFILLDELLAASRGGAKISLSLEYCEEGALLAVRPGMRPGQRRELFCHLMQFAGGSSLRAEAACTYVMFPSVPYRQFPIPAGAHEQVLTSH